LLLLIAKYKKFKVYMANIEKRVNNKGQVSYRVKVRIKGCPAQSATFSSITKAKEWASRTENKIKDGKYLSQVKAKKHTIAEMIDRYIKYILPQKPKVAYDWERYLNTFKDMIGSYTLYDATPSLISEARDKIADVKTYKGTKRSGATVNRYLTALSSVFGIAVREWEWLENNPMLKVSKMKEGKPRVRFLSDEERENLLNACKNANNPYLYPAVIIALSTGARKMEVLSLKWDNVDLQNGRAVLQETKNGERRSIPLVVEALKVLKELYNQRKSDIWVFPSLDKTKPFDITRSWRNALKEAKIENFRFHDLRHTTASYLAMNGASMGEIADILGHKTLQMVKRYSHLSDEHKRGVVESMNKKIFGGG
jgi:integrase